MSLSESVRRIGVEPIQYLHDTLYRAFHGNQTFGARAVDDTRAFGHQADDLHDLEGSLLVQVWPTAAQQPRGLADQLVVEIRHALRDDIIVQRHGPELAKKPAGIGCCRVFEQPANDLEEMFARIFRLSPEQFIELPAVVVEQFRHQGPEQLALTRKVVGHVSDRDPRQLGKMA